MRLLFALCSMMLPWSWKRWVMEKAFGFSIHPESRIGFSFVLPRKLVLEKGSRIGHLNVFKGLQLVSLAEHASIGNLNWVTGFPLGSSRHFAHQPERCPELVMNRHAAIASRHLLDCTARVTIGEYSIIGGFSTQLLTHSVDFAAARQSSAPIEIGPYCFLGTNCVVLGGSRLPHHSVLGAKSLLNKEWTEAYHLYGGVPAERLKPLSPDLKYFHREEGFIW